MRKFVVLAVSLLALVVGSLEASPAGAAAVPTVIDVSRPVTTTGHARSGWTVVNGTGSVDCSVVDPSLGAVSPNIERCAPDSAYAIACWKAATSTPHVLCLPNPRVHQLVKFARSGAFANTSVATSTHRAPLEMIVRTGASSTVVCQMRDGGAAVTLLAHPTWQLTYFCGAVDVWTSTPSTHLGINESTTTWSVHLSAANGHGSVTVHPVIKAYFTGSYTG